VDPQKSKKFEFSKEAQILMDKLNIPLIESYENLLEVKLGEDNNEEEKGTFMEEEFDQSRPMTTRIYDNEDDQYKYMLSPAFRNNNKHISVEAGLEGNIREDKEDNFDDGQYSMIIKNDEELEDCSEYPFASPMQTPTQGYRQDDTGDEDVMTVIEND
jgi:hypothetical protein